MPHDGSRTGDADSSHDGQAERPECEPDHNPLPAFACGDAIGMETVKADRHSRAALVRTVDSDSARHDTLGTTDTLGRNVRAVVVVMTSRVFTLPRSAI
jgi:hypothetical protein